jgi:hypothetical protein
LLVAYRFFLACLFCDDLKKSHDDVLETAIFRQFISVVQRYGIENILKDRFRIVIAFLKLMNRCEFVFQVRALTHEKAGFLLAQKLI